MRVVVLVLVLLVGLLLGILVMQPQTEYLPADSINPSAQSSIKVIDKRTIVRKMNALNRIETYSALVTTEFTLTKDEARSKLGDILNTVNLNDVLFGESLKIAGEGTVIAGVDLASLDDDSIKISADGTYVQVELPETRVFALNIDQDKTGVIEYRRGILIFNDGISLSEKAISKVHDELLNKACEAEITIKAADQAKANISMLILELNSNVRDVNVSVSAGDCKSIVPIK